MGLELEDLVNLRSQVTRFLGLLLKSPIALTATDVRVSSNDSGSEYAKGR